MDAGNDFLRAAYADRVKGRPTIVREEREEPERFEQTLRGAFERRRAWAHQLQRGHSQPSHFISASPVRPDGDAPLRSRADR